MGRGDQWSGARGARRRVALFGDLPFMVSGDSADVWARQDEFRLDASVGVPPDAFSDDGQDWGLPAYRWDVLAARDFDWLRHRARRNADLYDGYRVDHLVGFYRTYFRERDGDAGFTPPDEASQQALGERVLEVFREPGRRNHCRGPGHRSRFRPRLAGAARRAGLQGVSLGTALGRARGNRSGTRPTTRRCRWPRRARTTPSRWRSGGSRRRRKSGRRCWRFLRCGSVSTRRTRACTERDRSCRRRLRDALLEALYASGADLLILPIQDVFGWRDRINQPATVGDDNWTWRLPWPVDRLPTEPQADAVARQLQDWSERARARVQLTLSCVPAILAQASFSVTVRLNTGAPGANPDRHEK